jgi:hypothetical protein
MGKLKAQEQGATSREDAYFYPPARVGQAFYITYFTFYAIGIPSGHSI